jgi:hypothetical protein
MNFPSTSSRTRRLPEAEKVVRTAANPRNVQPELSAPTKIPATRNSEPIFAMRSVRATLELIDASHGGATAIAHSALEEETATRIIRVGLCSRHLLVDRALRRADTSTIKFLIGLSLVEYCLFWWHASDGKGVTDALREIAGYSLDENAWGSGIASRLAISEFLRPVDQLPIFGASPKTGPHLIGELKAVTRHPSDIPRWRLGAAAGEPLKRKPKAKPTPEAVRAEATAPPPVPSFAETFLTCSKEVLDVGTLTTLTELTKERLHD